MSFTVTWVNPSTGWMVNAQTVLQFAIQSTVTFSRVLVCIELPGFSITEVAIDTDTSSFAFKPAYQASSSAASYTTSPVGYLFSIARNSGWTDSPKVWVYAFDTSGGVFAQSYSFTLPVAASRATRVLPAPTAAPVIAPSSTQVLSDSPNDQEHFLSVLDGLYPPEWLDPIKETPNAGYEQLQASSAVGARVSTAISWFESDSLVNYATGGSYATGTVEFVRSESTNGAVTIAAGTIVRASNSGKDFVTQSSVSFGPTDLGPFAVSIQSIAVGYEFNLPGQVVTAGGEVIEGDIDTIQTYAVGSTFDPNMQVVQLLPTSGGVDAALDAIGRDIDIRRVPGESDKVYRHRITTSPDVVTPAAIRRGITPILAAQGASASILEVGTSGLPGFFFDAGSSADAVQNPSNNYAYDMDPTQRPADLFKCILSPSEFRGFFLVEVPRLGLGEFGFPFDGTSTDAYPYRNAFDGSSSDAVACLDFFDGYPAQDSIYYQSIYDTVDAKRAAGVGFDLVLTGDVNAIQQ